MEAILDAIYSTRGGLRSDSENQSSGSSSSSSLISQLARTNKARLTATDAKATAQTNGPTKTPVNPLRKAESDRLSVARAGRPTGNLEAKRRRAVSTSCGSSTGSASPPMIHAILWRQLQDKSRKFKQNYAKYWNLHASLAALNNPSREELACLQRQHDHLEEMKKQIWDEDRRLKREWNASARFRRRGIYNARMAERLRQLGGHSPVEYLVQRLQNEENLVHAIKSDDAGSGFHDL